MLLELGLAAAAALTADKLGLVNLTGTPAAKRQKAKRSTAPVPDAQQPNTLVAPSVPGSVIPTPATVDVHADPVTSPQMTLMSSLLSQSGQCGNQGAPYVDLEGYWRDFKSGKLYQFYDPNTNTPIGQPGYMPNRYAAFCGTQGATQATVDSLVGGGVAAGANTELSIMQGAQANAAADAAGTSSDSSSTGSDAVTAVRTGLQIAGTVATVAAGASDAAGTAAAVAGVAGSVLACLGPLPVAIVPGWHRITVFVFRAYDGDRALQISLTGAPDGSGVCVLAIEVSAAAAMALEDSTAAAARELYRDHAHELVGIYPSVIDAEREAERHAEHWRRRRADARERCACKEVSP